MGEGTFWTLFVLIGLTGPFAPILWVLLFIGAMMYSGAKEKQLRKIN